MLVRVLYPNITLQDCCICCEKLTHPSGYGEGKAEASVILKLSKCSHIFHKLCIKAMYESGSKVILVYVCLNIFQLCIVYVF